MASSTEPPMGLDWRNLVEHAITTHGGWAATADELVRRIRLGGQEPPDLATIEKGLRRLATRKNRSGGQYGRWFLRHLGIPFDVNAHLRWLGQYHSRWNDLPSSLRLEHMRLWDRPPTSESNLVVWVHIGFASVHLRRRETESCRLRLDAARNAYPSADPIAQLEMDLLTARVAMDEHRRDKAVHLLDQVDQRLDARNPEHICYRARVNAQRAYLLTRPARGEREDLDGALQLFLQIPDDSAIPFVDYRRTAGLAYCAWRGGDVAEGQRLARTAAQHAGDGGFIRFRVMALNLLSKMVDREDAALLRVRARRLAESIEDIHLTHVIRPR